MNSDLYHLLSELAQHCPRPGYVFTPPMIQLCGQARVSALRLAFELGLLEPTNKPIPGTVRLTTKGAEALMELFPEVAAEL